MLRSLEQGMHREALQFNDYVVVHIDTDVSEDIGFDVSHRAEGRELTLEELVAAVRARLVRELGAEFFKTDGNRIVFAIAVDATECWLLPLVYDNKKRAKISGCVEAVNQARRKANKKPLSNGAPPHEKKQWREYEDASKPYLKRKTLLACAGENPSLSLFVQRLEAIEAGRASSATPPTEP